MSQQHKNFSFFPLGAIANNKLKLTLTAGSLLLMAACSGEPRDQTASVEVVGADNPEVSSMVDQTPAAVTPVDAARITTASNSEWLSHGRTYSEQRNSPLSNINRNNVSELGLAWDLNWTPIVGRKPPR